MENLKAMAYGLRQDILDIVMAGKGGHIGGDMSVIDILTVLYFEIMNISPENRSDPDRDYFVMSKGHSVEALYAVLAAKGFFPLEKVLESFSAFGSEFIGHPNNKLPGIEMNSGSLGHGLPVCVGMALAGKRSGRSYRVYTVMGDGELAEGSVWEAAMAAANFGLDNLCATIDRNHLQISGGTEDVMRLEGLAEKFTAFGWNVIRVENGNDPAALAAAYREAAACRQTDASREAAACQEADASREAAASRGKPTLVLADTVKGCGSAVMEGKAEWHHRVPTQEEYRLISGELAARKERALHE